MCQTLIAEITPAVTDHGHLVTCGDCQKKIATARKPKSGSVFEGGISTQRQKRSSARQMLGPHYTGSRGYGLTMWMGAPRVPELHVRHGDAPLVIAHEAECGVEWLKGRCPELFAIMSAGLLNGALVGDETHWVKEF